MTSVDPAGSYDFGSWNIQYNIFQQLMTVPANGSDPEPDLAKSSEVEVRFTPEPGGRTRVDLEHRYLERHGLDADAIKNAIDSPEGWGLLLELYRAAAEQ